MTEQATAAQLTYRTNLIEQLLNDSRPGKGIVGGPVQGILLHALKVANLPEPQDKYEASIQIDALKGGTNGIFDYAAKHAEHYQAVVKRAGANLKAKYEGKIKPAQTKDDAAWVAFIRSL